MLCVALPKSSENVIPIPQQEYNVRSARQMLNSPRMKYTGPIKVRLKSISSLLLRTRVGGDMFWLILRDRRLLLTFTHGVGGHVLNTN